MFGIAVSITFTIRVDPQILRPTATAIPMLARPVQANQHACHDTVLPTVWSTSTPVYWSAAWSADRRASFRTSWLAG